MCTPCAFTSDCTRGRRGHSGTTYKDGINAPDVTEEDGDVNKHEDIANGHRQDVCVTLAIQFIGDRTLQGVPEKGEGRRVGRKIIILSVIKMHKPKLTPLHQKPKHYQTKEPDYTWEQNFHIQTDTEIHYLGSK